MPVIERLRDRVLLLRTFTEGGSQHELAKAIGISPKKLSIMINGSSDGDAPGNVPPTALKKFAAFISSVSKGRLNADAALAIMLAPWPEFAAQLFRLPLPRLDDVLARVPQTLPVETRVTQRGVLEIVDAPYVAPKGAIQMKRSQGVRFTLQTRLERQLVVLYHHFGGWVRLAPGLWHPGLIESERTLFPKDSQEPVRFKDDGSPYYRFVFIEALLPHPPSIGGTDPNQAALDRHDIAAFCELIGSLAAEVELRWGQVFLAPTEGEPRMPA